MDSRTPVPPRGTLRQDVFEGLRTGATGALSSLVNVFRPSTYVHAARQGGQLASAASHPQRSATALREAGTQAVEHADVRRTAARTVGDIAGGATALLGVTIAAAAAVRRPYLASRFGAELTRRYRAAPFLQHPFLQHPRVRDFAVTRPLALAVGAGVGTAAFVGGAQERAQTAAENRVTHPQIAAPLERGGLHELAATPVSRVVIASNRE